MKRILVFILLEILPLFIIYIAVMALSLWFTILLFNYIAWFDSKLNTTLININSLSSYSLSLAIFNGEGFVYMVWGALFLPLFYGTTTLFDKCIKPIIIRYFELIK